MRLARLIAPFAATFALSVAGSASAQAPAATPMATPKADPKEAVVDRVPLVLRDPVAYQVPLHLDPVRTLQLAAPVDSTVASILLKLGDQAAAQAEVVRLDAKLLQLGVTRAQAALRAAELEAKASSGAAKEAAEARAAVAKAEFDIAELRSQQTSIKAPFPGRVVKIHVTEGEYVRAGQVLATVIDTSQLVVELPIDRKTQKAGDSVDIKVEDQSAQVKLSAVLPLTPNMDRVRELFFSVGTGRGTLDNSSGKFQAGQTVYSSMIPRLPVAEVATGTLGNSDDGGRKVQVVRDGIVRDVKVQTLGQIGDDRIFVSGDFGPKDELVVKSSIPLVDGNRLTPRSGAGAAVAKGQPGPAAAPAPSALPPGAVPTPTTPKPSNF